MSTSEVRERQEQPEPLQLVDTFKQAHGDMLRDAMATYTEPSSDMLLTTADRLQACQESINPFREQIFFKDAENPLFTNLALTTIIEATDELLQRIRSFNPGRDVETFRPGIQPWLEFCITGDETLELPDEANQWLVDGDTPTPEQTANITCNVYLGMLATFEEAVMNTESIQDFMESRDIEMQMIAYKVAEKADRMDKAKLLGAVVAAAFAGTYLANKLQERR